MVRSGTHVVFVWPFLSHLPQMRAFPGRTHMPQMDAFASLQRFPSYFSFIVRIPLAVGRQYLEKIGNEDSLCHLLGLEFLGPIYFFVPTPPCMNLTLLCSHALHSQNNKRLIYWLPFAEFPMLQMCACLGVSPHGSSGSGILQGSAGPERPLTSP